MGLRLHGSKMMGILISMELPMITHFRRKERLLEVTFIEGGKKKE